MQTLRASRTEEAFRPATAFRALQNPSRRRVLEVLRVRGAQTFAELADYLALSNLKLHYHLGLLEEAGLVRFRKTAGTALTERVVVFRPVGWARMKKLWGDGMEEV